MENPPGFYFKLGETDNLWDIEWDNEGFFEEIKWVSRNKFEEHLYVFGADRILI